VPELSESESALSWNGSSGLIKPSIYDSFAIHCRRDFNCR